MDLMQTAQGFYGLERASVSKDLGFQALRLETCLFVRFPRALTVYPKGPKDAIIRYFGFGQ